MKFALVIGFALILGIPAQLRSAVVPEPVPGWRMELVAEAPAVNHPSVVCTAPDGRIFVAEDPMDIRAPANAALGRILCLHPDGRTTVFAEQLHAVFGMQYLDGKLYVLHNPRFSVFTDDRGIGRNREDLIEQTNPDPWALDWNDHVPANFRLGMDGFFYVAVGDKGIYGAVGRDGARVDLHGGGILRLRPDGTRLEVYCTGNRNILDVAMNAEDEFFTYDNTDEQEWMGRVTHMVDGGFYGYPHDFIPRRPYTLWRMADYGAGAATGTVCYNEDALPEEYRGNLFLADFGKRQVIRVRIEREGATYRAVERIDLFPDPPPDFRPVGIAWTADARSLLICDWAHRDTKADVSVGRLWKLTYAGSTQAASKPNWFVPAAQGEPFTASIQEMTGALSHPSHAVRLTAQRRLAGRAAEDRSGVVQSLSSILADPRAQARARVHALWALDAIDEAHAARSLILKATVDDAEAVRLQALRQLGTREVREAAASITNRLGDPSASVRFHAATALGRIGHPLAIPPLIETLAAIPPGLPGAESGPGAGAAPTESDVFLRYALFTALNRIGRRDPVQWPAIAAGLQHSSPAVREGTAFALRETYDIDLARELSRIARDSGGRTDARVTALRLLGALHHRAKPWAGEWWAYHPVNQPPPSKTESWEGTSLVLSTLTGALVDPIPAIRLAAVEAVRNARHREAAGRVRALLESDPDTAIRRESLLTLGALQDQESIPLVESLLAIDSTDGSLRTEAIIAAGWIGGERLVRALIRNLSNPAGDPGIAAPTIQALGRLKAKEAAGAIAARIADDDPALREAAVEALVEIGADAATAPVLALLETGDPRARRGAVVAAGRLKNPAAVPALLKAFDDEDLRADAILALTRIPDERAVPAYLDGLGGRNAALRESCRKAIGTIRQRVLPAIEHTLDSLAPDVIAELRIVYADLPGAEQSRLFSVAVAVPDAAAYETFALSTPGDPARGRVVFFNESGAACVKCHVVGSAGGRVGPDLTSIGAQFGRAALIESILQPSKVVREGYNQVQIEMEDDDLVTGLFKGETADDILLLDAANQLRKVPKARIKSRHNSELSIMPEGLHAVLSLQEFADLLAYLETLKSSQPAP